VSKYIFLIIVLISFSTSYAQHSNEESTLQYIGDVSDVQSLQRGAKHFINTCMGCHDLRYMRYSQLAEGLNLSDEELSLLLRAGSGRLDTILNALADDDAIRWFGAAPPDLSLVSRSLGTEYLFNFLTGFYPDVLSTTGVNNHALPNTSMPNVFWAFDDGHNEDLNDTTASSELIYVATDIVNFLDYVGEPMQIQRRELGKKVIGFLLLFLVIAYALKREIWKEVK
jgi:ubiquinol-cytochrome c reductase cytochrome c1 subunit